MHARRRDPRGGAEVRMRENDPRGGCSTLGGEDTTIPEVGFTSGLHLTWRMTFLSTHRGVLSSLYLLPLTPLLSTFPSCSTDSTAEAHGLSLITGRAGVQPCGHAISLTGNLSPTTGQGSKFGLRQSLLPWYILASCGRLGSVKIIRGTTDELHLSLDTGLQCCAVLIAHRRRFDQRLRGDGVEAHTSDPQAGKHALRYSIYPAYL